MDYFAPPLAKLIEQFEKLPSIGHKTAQRLAFYVVSQPEVWAKDFADALIDAKQSIKYCEECQNLTSSERCGICSSNRRDKSVICGVEDPRDVVALEKTGEVEGLYHVLHGAISPMNGIGPDELKIKELLSRNDNNNAVSGKYLVITGGDDSLASSYNTCDKYIRLKVKYLKRSF